MMCHVCVSLSLEREREREREQNKNEGTEEWKGTAVKVHEQ